MQRKNEMTTTNCKTVSGATMPRTIWKRMFHVFMSMLVLFLAAALFTSCKKGSGDWKKGVSSMKDGEYEDAVEHFKDSAEKGNTDSQMMLAICYAAGIGVDEKDYDNDSKKYLEKAVKQLKKAAKSEDPVAMAAYGAIMFFKAEEIRDSDDREADKKEALKYLKKSADQDCVFGQLALAWLYLDDEDEDMQDKGVKLLKKVADRPMSKKKIFLDEVKMSLFEYVLEKEPRLKDDDDTAQIISAIEDILEKDEITVSNAAIIVSQIGLCAAYAAGRGVDQDLDKAEKWLDKAKKSGLPKVIYTELKKDLKESADRERRRSSYYDDDYDY
jgi:tetratricopeptide (TPR) repeat protein